MGPFNCLLIIEKFGLISQPIDLDSLQLMMSETNNKLVIQVKADETDNYLPSSARSLIAYGKSCVRTVNFKEEKSVPGRNGKSSRKSCFMTQYLTKSAIWVNK